MLLVRSMKSSWLPLPGQRPGGSGSKPTMTATDLARAEGLAPNHVDRLLRLAFLSPAGVIAILNATAPSEINLERLKDVELIARR
jgi:hypothetical protein